MEGKIFLGKYLVTKDGNIYSLMLINKVISKPRKEPFETGILLDFHVKESSNRIERYKLSLNGEVRK